MNLYDSLAVNCQFPLQHLSASIHYYENMLTISFAVIGLLTTIFSIFQIYQFVSFKAFKKDLELKVMKMSAKSLFLDDFNMLTNGYKLVLSKEEEVIVLIRLLDSILVNFRLYSPDINEKIADLLKYLITCRFGSDNEYIFTPTVICKLKQIKHITNDVCVKEECEHLLNMH